MKTNKLRISFFLSLFLILALSANTQAQDKKDRPSPPKTASATVDGAKVEINYSSPAVKERKVWGALVPYNEIWRMGANEATTITLEKDYTINGTELKAGKYSLFAIPGEKEWTVILNSIWDQWGAYNYDKSKDALRFTVTPEKSKEFQERLNFTISDEGKVAMEWENSRISFDLE